MIKATAGLWQSEWWLFTSSHLFKTQRQICSCADRSNIRARPHGHTEEKWEMLKTTCVLCCSFISVSVFVKRRGTGFAYNGPGLCSSMGYGPNMQESSLICASAALPGDMGGFERLSQSIIMKPRVKRPGCVSSAAGVYGPSARNSPVMNKYPPSVDIWWIPWFRVVIHRLICIFVMPFQDYIKPLKYHTTLWPQRWSCRLFLTDSFALLGRVQGLWSSLS